MPLRAQGYARVLGRYTVEDNLDLASRIKLCVLVNAYSLVTKIITDLFTTQIFNYHFIILFRLYMGHYYLLK